LNLNKTNCLYVTIRSILHCIYAWFCVFSEYIWLRVMQ